MYIYGYVLSLDMQTNLEQQSATRIVLSLGFSCGKTFVKVLNTFQLGFCVCFFMANVVYQNVT